MDEFVTVGEIAERLKINPQTVRNWIDRGELPAIRVGARRVRVKSVDLDAFLGLDQPGVEQPHDEAREGFQAALDAAGAAESDGELAAALRELSTAAAALARALG